MKKRISSSGIYTAIDIGTTKICVLIAQQIDNEHCEILGIGKAPSEGLARGVVVDIGPAVQSIKQAIKEAELMANYTIESAYVGVSGSHIQAFNSQGMTTIKHGQVLPHTISQVLDAAKAIPLPEEQQILHVIPQHYIIDGTQKVKHPLGMHGVRLEAHVHIITGGITSVQNLIRCCQIAGVKVEDVVLEPVASAEAILNNDEQELGAAILDIGGGTADFAVCHNGAVRHTKIIPIAGNMFTTDLALCLRTSKQEAERLKREHGILPAGDNGSPLIIGSIDGLNQMQSHTKLISEVVKARAEELLLIVHNEIETYNLRDHMPAGLVITGGGSLLQGLPELTQQILRVPARVGAPRLDSTFKESLESPMYATSYGLLKYALKQKAHDGSEVSGPLINRVFWRMKSWIADLF